ncbi:MAG: polysaccharide deacetylase family protein [Candidatus Manganitrophus sp. SA1]|nr:polysaccharide deacetylase family protein [Candidatus Manganitrophus morganii]
MKNIIKKITFSFLYGICLWKRRRLNNLLVLTYHRVSETPDFEDSLKVSLKNFENQMRFIKKNYHIISGEELAEIIKNKQSFPSNSCLITFDDGWIDNYTNAFPVLKRHRIPAIIFISTDYVNTSRVFWHEQLIKIFEKTSPSLDINKLGCTLKTQPGLISEKIRNILRVPISGRRPLIEDLISYLKGFDPKAINDLVGDLQLLVGREEDNGPTILSWDQIKEMSQNNVCFGSHAKSHDILTIIPKSQIKEEILESKKIIENKLGKPVHFIAYPNGNYDAFVTQITREAGYLAGFTCVPGTNASLENPYELKRRHVLEELSLGMNNRFSELAFKTELSGIRSDIKRWVKRGNLN